MELFLRKYLRWAQALYFAIGITIMPLCAQWFWPSLDKTIFFTYAIVTFIYSIIVSMLIHFVIRNLFWKLALIGLSSILVIAILFPIFEFSPFILAILGVATLSSTMQFFDSITKAFPEINDIQIRRWLEVSLTLFVIFISSMMVGFTISWNSLYGDAIRGLIKRQIVITGINANLIITIYFWFGAALVFFSGIKHLQFIGKNQKKNS